ncbi:chromophore lyase CpcT/CpeT [bacterium]|nr:chromophore lyase CpcT/CpeT [bacterium]
MKKIIAIIMISLLFSNLYCATMIVNKTDGSVVEINIADIENISFSEEQTGSLELLVDYMTGSFSSEEQAENSSDPYHVDVRLIMVRIWDHLSTDNGYWLYVEQAYAEQLNAPYRQRIYRVFEEDGQLKDEIYAIPTPATYVGAWESPEEFDNINEDDLTLKPGCGLEFNWNGDHFSGATLGTDCTATIPGVSYITSETSIFPTYLTSWDLGYNSAGTIVMGPYSPYIFDKIENF